MDFIQNTAPHLRKPNASVVRMMRDVVIALSPLVVLAIINHGLRAVWIMLVAVLSMAVTEYIYYQIHDAINRNREGMENLFDQLAKLKKALKEAEQQDQKDTLKKQIAEIKQAISEKKRESKREENKRFHPINKNFTLYNYSILVSGVIYGLTIPDATPLAIVIIGGVVAVILVKLIFGGMGQNIFNVAAFGRAFIALSFGGLVAVANHVDATSNATVLGELVAAPFSETGYSLTTMFTGIGLPGTLGEVSAMLILVGGIYLFLRKSFDVFIPLVYVGTVFVLALATMLVTDAGWWFPLTHLLSGGLLFGAIYMATDPITAPVTRPGRIYFAFGLGLITFVIRLFGAYPEGVVFAILIMNIFVPAIDFPKWSHTQFNWRRAIIFTAVVLLSITAVMIGAESLAGGLNG